MRTNLVILLVSATLLSAAPLAAAGPQELVETACMTADSIACGYARELGCDGRLVNDLWLECVEHRI
ncbi:MAG TPA: hypothetical protein VM582_05780 [Candidatus Thermoplasmatota archaeon]|nr:hypothetical protein [Candidatus Thermoplasmatota archaeon]